MNNTIREYHPPHTNILYTFKTKTYKSYTKAIDEFVDNSIDAFLRAYLRNNKTREFKFILFKKQNDLIIMDNGDGAVGEEIRDVVVLGSSGTKRSGITNSHGTFGAGATSAALYLVNSETDCNFTVVSFRGDKASYACFDLKGLEEDENPWGYDFSHDPSSNSDFQEKLDFLKEQLGSTSVSGTAMFIKDGANLFPVSTSSAWQIIAKSIQVNYAKRFKDFCDKKLEIQFDFYSDGSKGVRKSVKSGFNSWTSALDSLNYSISPQNVVWYHGGPDFQYERHNICGVDCGIRMSQFMQYRDRSKDDPWSHGYMNKSPQGIGFIRNGKRIECSTTKGWTFDGWKRSILVEVEYEGDHHPHLRVNQEKTEVLLSDAFEKELVGILRENVRTAAEANNLQNSHKTLEGADVEHIREGIGQVLGSSRKSKTETGKVLPESQQLNVESKTPARQNSSYVGNTDNIKLSSSKKRTVLPVFKIVDDWASRYTPFSKTIDISGPKPQVVIIVNKKHPFTNSLLEAGCLDALYTTAASMLIGPSTYEKEEEEIFLEIERFGEMYSTIADASGEAKKNKLQAVS